MARVNLLTIHYGQCYGAVFQTYATCKMLEEAGHEVKVINLIHPNCKRKFTNLRACVFSLYREFQFWMFKKRYFSPLTKKMYALNQTEIPSADICIVGSDQVWNRNITGIFDLTFYLSFVNDNTKKIALCSSFGKDKWIEDEEYTEGARRCFQKFHAISVREASGSNILEQKFGVKSIVLLDPTLEYGKFEHFVTDKRQKAQIFSFLLKPQNEMLQFISQNIGLPLLRKNRLGTIFKRGPINWLTDIYQSKLVITDSFHGLALSIMFRKQFIVFCADVNKFTRLRSLLEILSLEDKFVQSKEDFIKRKESILSPIDYDRVHAILKKERGKCKDFINSYIN